jgi:hypothetical protein
MNGRVLGLLMLAVGVLIPVPAAASSVLLGSRTLSASNDLTAIETGGTVREWLDLSVTDGMSVTGALDAYGGLGFTWATGAEVADLYSAFGINYAISAGQRLSLQARADAMEQFVSYFGFTTRDDPFLRPVGALGWINDLSGATSMTYSCLSVSGGCSPFSFVDNVTGPSFWPRSDRIGVYMVRDAPHSVAEPATLALVLMGAGAVMGRSRIVRRRETSTEESQGKR